MVVRVGVALIPEVNPAVDGRWRRVEDLGFAHSWCLDHLAWRDLAGSDWHATVPVLTAAALTTATIRLGTFVASPNFRHPVPFAKDVMTLDVLSGGRVVVAVGAGAPGYDAAILGGPALAPGDRMERFEEFVELLDRMLRGRRITWSGRWYSAVDAPTIPGAVQSPRPDFVIAANGPRGMRLALRHGQGWVTSGAAPFGTVGADWWAGVAETARRFDEVAAAAPPSDRAGGPLRRYVDVSGGPGPFDSVEKLADDVGRLGELGFTDVVLPWPRPGPPFAGSESVFEEFGQRLRGGVLT